MDDAHRARTNRLRWHCRRALLELDLVFERFWECHPEGLEARDEAVLEALLELEDHDLWALVSGREKADDASWGEMIERLRGMSPAANFQ